MNSDVAVLIVNYNVRRALCRAVASVAQDAHTVVVDNASSDDSLVHLAKHHPQVTVCALPTNRGFSYAINRAASLCTEPYLLLLNPDAWLGPTTLVELKDSLQRHRHSQGTWVVAPKQVDERGRLQLSVGATPGLATELMRRTVQRRLDRPETLAALLTRGALSLYLRRPTKVAWAAGSALFLRRTDFFRVGGFDPQFFLYFEDIDFCLRVAQAGGGVLFDPTISVGHSRGLSARGAKAASAAAYRDSQRYYAKRHMGPCAARAFDAWARHKQDRTPRDERS